jgi:uroporphyrinogen-III synthase
VAKIVITRPPDRARALADRLRELGHDVILCPLIATTSAGDEPIDVAGYDWVVVTSVRGAQELRRRARGAMPRVAAIGRATAEAMGRVDLVPPVATQEGLLAAFPESPGRVLVAAAEGARRLIIDALGADFVPLYRTRELDIDALPDCDLVVVASASAARALAKIDRSVPVVSIGPQTSRAAVRRGLVVLAEAETHDLDGLVAAVHAAARSAP